ncbi:MAG TPA: hypothetical protein VE136_16050 [Anaerolineales bacterium]|jgi:hypothetical protein|nr:hypothetical protein [Anaerolineales bacterium]
MAKIPEFDLAAAHRYFAAECFNRAWDLIDKAERTPEEDEDMIRLNQASLYHWSQREDCTNRNLSVGYWQAARIYALLSQADNARRYGQLCLHYSQGEGAFYLGYAYEALARAEAAAGEGEKSAKYLQNAQQQLAQISDPEERVLLEKDLQTIVSQRK